MAEHTLADVDALLAAQDWSQWPSPDQVAKRRADGIGTEDLTAVVIHNMGYIIDACTLTRKIGEARHARVIAGHRYDEARSSDRPTGVLLKLEDRFAEAYRRERELVAEQQRRDVEHLATDDGRPLAELYADESEARSNVKPPYAYGACLMPPREMAEKAARAIQAVRIAEVRIKRAKSKISQA